MGFVEALQGRGSSNLIQRSGESPPSVVLGDNVEVQRGPICKEHRFFAFRGISFDTAIAFLAIVDPERIRTGESKCRELSVVHITAKRTSRAPVPPVCCAATTNEKPDSAGFTPSQLSESRYRATRWTVRSEPKLVVA